MGKRIKAKVAAVISDKEIAINVGAVHGVNPADEVTLFETINVTDPDTQEPLGSVSRPVLDLTVVEVQERISVARITSDVFTDLFGVAGKRITRAASGRGSGVSVSPGDPVDVTLLKESASS